jgi:hypothetical protein
MTLVAFPTVIGVAPQPADACSFMLPSASGSLGAVSLHSPGPAR